MKLLETGEKLCDVCMTPQPDDTDELREKIRQLHGDYKTVVQQNQRMRERAAALEAERDGDRNACESLGRALRIVRADRDRVWDIVKAVCNLPIDVEDSLYGDGYRVTLKILEQIRAITGSDDSAEKNHVIARAESALFASAPDMSEWIITMADEEFGPFPAQTVAEAQAAISDGLFAQRQRVDELEAENERLRKVDARFDSMLNERIEERDASNAHVAELERELELERVKAADLDCNWSSFIDWDTLDELADELGSMDLPYSYRYTGKINLWKELQNCLLRKSDAHCGACDKTGADICGRYGDTDEILDGDIPGRRDDE